MPLWLVFPDPVTYDPAFYYTSQKMKDIKGIDIDVPAEIQKPEIHIIGQSSSSTQDQSLFVNIRRQCLQQLEINLKPQLELKLVMLFGFFMAMAQLHSLKLATNKVDHTVVLAVVHTVEDLQT